MKNADIKQEIIDFSESIGIDKIGFASADPFVTMKARLADQQANDYQSGFEKGTIEERTEPERLLPEAKSIISIALAYPSKMTSPPRSKKGERRGIFCRASWGEDYHHILRRKLEQLQTFIAERFPDESSTYMVDTGELPDRAVAERAGIGWSGKNCAIITPGFGSYVYLGELITTVDFAADTPLFDQCGTCNKCVDACPTGALIQGGQLDSGKCIAYLTQTKDVLPEQYRKKIGNRLYGCDTCQVVCPENKGVDVHHHPEMEPDPEVVKPLLVPLLTMSNREFKQKFGAISGAWRGKKPIQRNALIALGNFKDETALDAVFDRLENDPRPVIRATAAWAAAEISSEKLTAERIQTALEQEEDETAITEMTNVLNRLKHETGEKRKSAESKA
ncbi:tRNA epoxyqueuosine(34) reductase QueG [Salisediminibacterium halotolerans]|uniref:tRNA epoxyqueuosine(34) reductase QueG n=1 Tax=Salisediminibacterium halotolerans TaxID=517425 RepID=UPI000EB21FE2|nr:tRNA epoxyqueuosine(34) reductase QueG [Salisediminibacterium halotolerans]RLJ72321.1 epoxyqueuosine reductase [Actinophytocola xinjiangensis]RPE85535.1 epoxyqueuosine reductase [Salisediminibacterium halotolerans]TWG33490.1 epoxyqueuosine reductase [Salisediminibacterium halotolerans]GEL09018.1 epoxyqueuosine reductase [Salisediminibacterium halotolerans]